MEKVVLYKAEDIFTQGNLHMANKLKHFGKQGQAVVKYVISKLRKYRGEFFECNETVAENVGCSVRTVQNAIKRAEQLEIFSVTSRKEQTLNGKFRQTTNKIQLLSFEAVEVVKEVVEEVRSIASKVAQKAVKTAKKVFTPKARKNKSKSNYKPNTYARTEIVPEWINKPYETPVMTDEEKAAFERRRSKLQAELKRKYAK